MKEIPELMQRIDALAWEKGNDINPNVFKELEQWEKDIRKDQVNKCAESIVEVFDKSSRGSMLRHIVIQTIQNTIEANEDS